MRNFLPKEDIIVLQEAHHVAREKRKADRIKTVLLLNQGYPYSEIARILLLNDSTAREYFKEYQKLGLDGLVKDNYSGSESFLSVSEQTDLTLYLKERTLKTVKEYVEQSGRIHLVFLPPYSPNLNIIERLWLFLHQKVLYDKYYETFPQFKEAVENFFKNIDTYKVELKTRLTDSFQVIPA